MSLRPFRKSHFTNIKPSISYPIICAVIFISFSLPILAQDCPPLPKREIPYQYVRADEAEWPSELTAHESIVLHEAKNTIRKANAVKLDFNEFLREVRQLPCRRGELSGEKLFRFQTTERLSDSLEIQTTVQDLRFLLQDTGLQSANYGGIIQRDWSQISDVRLTNWYIKRFQGNELQQLCRERTVLARLCDSLNMEISTIRSGTGDWQQKDPLIHALTKQLTFLARSRDSLDLLLYPTLQLELEPWYKTYSQQAPDQDFTKLAAENVILSDKDAFLQKKFRLHHGYIDDPYSGKSIIPGNAEIREGTHLHCTGHPG